MLSSAIDRMNVDELSREFSRHLEATSDRESTIRRFLEFLRRGSADDQAVMFAALDAWSEGRSLRQAMLGAAGSREVRHAA